MFMPKLSKKGLIMRRIMHCVTQIGVTIALIGAVPTLHAQRIKYNNEDEIFGAAAHSPEAGRQVLKRIVGRCAEYGARSRAVTSKALADWEKRHQNYLDENVIVKQEVATMSNAPGVTPDERKFLDQMNNVVLPKMIESQVATYVVPLEAMPTVEMKAQLCFDYAASIADLKWDLKVNDPIVAAYLDARIRKRSPNQQSK